MTLRNCFKTATNTAAYCLPTELPIKLWHGQFQDPTVADAILDRLVHNAQIVELTAESMRKQSAPTHPKRTKPPQKSRLQFPCSTSHRRWLPMGGISNRIMRAPFFNPRATW